MSALDTQQESINLKRKEPPAVAEDVVESLDGDTTTTANKEQKIEDTLVEHIYMEPKQLVDLELVYCGTVFHVHKAILYKESKYFQTLIDGEPNVLRVDLIKCTEIDCGCKPANSFYSFLKCLYDAKLVLPWACLRGYRLCCTGILFLSHYYDTPRIDQALENDLIKKINRRDRCDCLIIEDLLLALKFNWHEAEETIINQLKSNLHERKHTNYIQFQTLWKQLPGDMRERILWSAVQEG